MHLHRNMLRSSPRATTRGRWLLAGAASLLVAAGAATAYADIPEPPQPDDDDEQLGVCLPDKQPGDDCELPNGDDGICAVEEQECGFSGGQTVYCHVCEESGCSIAGVGMSAPGGIGWLALGALVVLAAARRRR